MLKRLFMRKKSFRFYRIAAAILLLVSLVLMQEPAAVAQERLIFGEFAGVCQSKNPLWRCILFDTARVGSRNSTVHGNREGDDHGAFWAKSATRHPRLRDLTEIQRNHTGSAIPVTKSSREKWADTSPAE